MIKHKNLVKHDPENGTYGDCHRACIATILGTEPTRMPHFYHDPVNVDGEKLIDDYLAQFGLKECVTYYPGGLELSDIMQTVAHTMKDVAVILGGTSRSGCNHSVVLMNGEIFNDPTEAGIVGPLNNGFYAISTLAARPDFVHYAIGAVLT